MPSDPRFLLSFAMLGSYDNTYDFHMSGVRGTVTLWEDVVVRTDATHKFYDGLRNACTRSYMLWIGGVGKKLFGNGQGG